jgi:hypothetical protein
MVSRTIMNWNSTLEEQAMPLPCDRYLSVPYRSVHRAIDIAAPVPVVFRWLCQLKLAPYSYDWIDNAGRRSPQTLTPGAERLAVGQSFLIAAIEEFEIDRHISGRGRRQAERLYGPLAATYLVRSAASGDTRLLVRLNVGLGSWVARVRMPVLVAGDLIMMRKQLLNLKRLAERDAAA